MNIYISEEAVVGDIQKRFQEFYPYLKLVFYRNPHTKGVCAPKAEIVAPDTPIDKIRIIHSFGWLDISYFRTALAVEHDLSYQYGLHAQILRRSGDLWLETTVSDSWTLEELNNAGRPSEPQQFQLPDEMEEED